MMTGIQIRSNISNRLAKVREGVVYDSVTSVLGELAQNAQRAQATEVSVVIANGAIVMHDNGKGCADPQQIFEMDSSGWGLDEAFGEGFFSTFVVADTLAVSSADWEVNVDVAKVIETNDVDLNVKRVATPIEGFRVVLRGTKIQEHEAELIQFMEELASLMPQDVAVNGIEVPKLDLTKVNAPYSESFETDLYTATIAPATGWMSYVKVYYESRFVCELYVDGLSGNLVLKQNAVTLKAPDRRAIVFDDKRAEFLRVLREDTKTMYKHFVEVATDSDLDKYAQEITEYLEVEDYLALLPMSEEELRAEKAEEERREMMDVDIALNMGIESEHRPVALQVSDNERTEETQEITTQVVTKRKQENKKQVKKLEVLRNQRKVAWVKASEAESSQELIKELEYYGFKILVARNKLYELSFSFLGIVSIHEIESTVNKNCTLTNIGATTKKEKRVMWMLERIEKYYGLVDVFRIADIDMKLEHYRNGRLVEKEKTEVNGLFRREGDTKRIYLDRKALQLPSYRVDKWDSANLNLNDLRMLLKNIEVVAHELAHLLYGTNDNTIEHTDAQSKIMKEIAELF